MVCEGYQLTFCCVKMFKKPGLWLCLLVPQFIFCQNSDTITLSEYQSAIGAIIASFFFQGALFIMTAYVFSLFIQNKKKDYLCYAIYLLLLTFYLFTRIELTTGLNVFKFNQNFYYYLLTPLNFALAAAYVKFINVFAGIKKYNASFSKRLNVFTVIMYSLAALVLIYTVITNDFKTIEKYQYVIILPMHIYTLLALLRAFIVIKSKLRYYVLFANIFLLTFSMIGYYNAAGNFLSESIKSHYLFGFYTFNATQLGAFLEVVCFSLGLGYKFNLNEKEKNDVKQKYIEQLKENEIVTKQLNEELTDLVKKRTKEIKAKNKLLKKEKRSRLKFFTNISHEFRTPLTLILGPIQELLKKKNLKSEWRNDFLLIRRNSNRLLSLVNQLLDISKLESGNLKLKVNNGLIIPFVEALIKEFSFCATQKKITYIVDIQSSKEYVWYDKDMVEKIITNLISNAVKYTPVNGTIICESTIDEKFFYFNIKNTGVGLTDKEIEKVFNRFYQIDNHIQGIGIGLALVKELVTIHKGTISVKSIPNEWTHFNAKLPISKSAFCKNEFDNNSNLETVDEISGKEPIEWQDDKAIVNKENPIMLIVDDNIDLRMYLKELFKNEYQVYLAKNGREGLDLAVKHIPDIIMSDVMMPVLDGIKLCNYLKTDQRTSHIPIILLTAKAGEENELEGIQTGADDYITKPFKNILLKAKVNTLLNNRAKTRKFYNHEIELKVATFSHNLTEEKFFNLLQEVINDKLQDVGFNVNDFSKFVGMSRMQLHRKLKATLGINASEFIRTERLKSSKELLHDSNLTISEIAYTVGFNDANYYSKSFKKLFKISPTDFRMHNITT